MSGGEVLNTSSELLLLLYKYISVACRSHVHHIAHCTHASYVCGEAEKGA